MNFEIWLVDDKEALRNITSRLLRSLYPESDLKVFEAPEAFVEALSGGGVPHYALIDYQMPPSSIDGGLLAAYLRSVSPEVRIVLYSGIAVELRRKLLSSGVDVLLQKPAMRPDIKRALSEADERHLENEVGRPPRLVP